MHPEVVDDKAGACPACKMALVPVRLELDWSCPVHTSVIDTHAGRCPICRRTLVQITAAVSWTCASNHDLKALQPGTCQIDGTPLVVTRERRPHGDHNPRHGGVFFMAADNSHHLEGTYPQPGVFRVFLYDEYTRPLSLRGVSGRAVTRESRDASSNRMIDLEAFALRPSRDGKYLEARIAPRAGTSTGPMQITAKLQFAASGPEQRFDFAFPALTREPPPPPRAPASPTNSVVLEAMPAAPATQAVPEAPPATAGTAAILAALVTNSDRVGALLDSGAYTEMYFPALAAKEAALALDEHAVELPQTRRTSASDAVRRVVLGAWQIDFYGDIGDRPRLAEAYQSFAAAVAELKVAYGPAR